MSVKMMFLDIDGTLVNSEKQISPKTLEAVSKAQKKGIAVTIASGRPTKGVLPYAEKLRLSEYGGYIMPFNGAKIINCKTNETILSTSMPIDIFKKAHSLAKSNGFEIITYDDSFILSETDENKYMEIESSINKIPVKNVGDLKEYVNFNPVKCLILGNPEPLEKFEKVLQENLKDTAQVFRSEPFFLEVMPKGIDKALSIEKFIKKMGIRREEIIACGDGYNDISMIKFAGIGAAMCNGCERIKAAADYVTRNSNDNDGIAEIIKQFVL